MNNTPAPTPPPVNPTPPPTAPKPDTVYLVKTRVNYYYDSTGTKILDSTTSTYKYDAQRRFDSSTYLDPAYGKGEKYITGYSYPTNQIVTSQVTFDGPDLVFTYKKTVYLGPSQRVDSILEAGNNLLDVVTGPYSYISYFRYDGGGNILTDSVFILTPSSGFNGYTQYSYSNNSLVSQVQFSPDGTRQFSQYFQAGNLVSDTSFGFGGSVVLADAYTYQATLVGGFSTYYGGPNFLATAATKGNVNFFHVYSYTFDSANRVSNIIIRQSSGTLVEKDVFTYY